MLTKVYTQRYIQCTKSEINECSTLRSCKDKQNGQVLFISLMGTRPEFVKAYKNP